MKPPAPPKESIWSTKIRPVIAVFQTWSARLDEYINRYALWIEILIVAAGAVLRFVEASGTYLNPDEALHFDIAKQGSLLATYRTGLTNAHPPFYFLFLYFWRFLGNSELFLRLPAILAGTALIWVCGRWLGRVAGRAVGLAAMLIIAFSPPLIFLGAEVRGYSALLFWMAMALLCLQHALQSDSVFWMRRYSIFLWMAILTHYSALWFTVTLGVYVLLRVRELSRRTQIGWLVSQVVGVGLYAFLWVTHLSHLQGGGMQREMTDGWLRASYFQGGMDTPLDFVARASKVLFQFLFAQVTGGEIALALFLGSLIVLVVAGLRHRMQATGPLSFAVLLLLPFSMTAIAAVERLYPYGGTRHDVFLVVFAIAGVSLCVAAIAGFRSWAVLLIAAMVLPVWHSQADPMPQALPFENQRVELMQQAVDYIHASIKPGSMIFIDNQSSTLVSYYLCRNEVMESLPGKDGFYEINCGTYKFILSPQWMLSPEGFATQIARVHAAYKLKPQDQIWVFNGGWGINLLDQVSVDVLGPQPNSKAFGPSISVFQVVNAPPPEPPADTVLSSLRINAGGPAYVDPDGRQWSADSGFTGGAALRELGPVSGTFAIPLYEDQRQDTSPFRYDFKLANKDYKVILRFAEIGDKTQGQRAFDVTLNHAKVLTNFDIFVAAGGTRKAVDKEFIAHVTDGLLSIEFNPVRSGAAISALEVIPQ